MFGERLLIARKRKRLTLEQLAELYNSRFDGNLSKGTLSKYENNKQEPMISTVGNLALILGISVDFLVNDEKNTNIDNSVVIINHNGKIIKKKFSEEQMKYLEKFIESLADEENTDL